MKYPTTDLCDMNGCFFHAVTGMKTESPTELVSYYDLCEFHADDFRANQTIYGFKIVEEWSLEPSPEDTPVS